MIAASSPTTSTDWTTSGCTTGVYTITTSSGYVTGESHVNDIYVFYSNGPPTANPIEEFKSALSARRALFLAWNKEARTALFKMTFDNMPFPGRPLGRLCYHRERQAMPIRQLFRKRVCGGHQRYRVMRP